MTTRGNLYSGWFSTNLWSESRRTEEFGFFFSGYHEIGNRWRQSTFTDGGCRGIKPCTSYSRTKDYVKLSINGYDTAYTFTQNNITLEHNAMNNMNTVAHMNVHNTQYWAHCAPFIDAHWCHIAPVAQVRLARVIPSMHVHLCVALWLISHRSPSSPSRCSPQCSPRSLGPTPCATSAWGPWPLLTTRHPSHKLLGREEPSYTNMLSSYRQQKYTYLQTRCCLLEAKLQNVAVQHDLSILTYRPLHRTIATQQPRKTKPHLHGLALWSGNVLVTMTNSEVMTGHPQHPSASREEGSGWPKSPLADAWRGWWAHVTHAHGSGAQIHNSLSSKTTTLLPKTVGEQCTGDAIKMETLDQSSLGLSHAWVATCEETTTQLPIHELPLQTRCFSLKHVLKHVTKITRITKHDVEQMVRGHIARREIGSSRSATPSALSDGRLNVWNWRQHLREASFGCEHGRTSFQGVEVHDVSLPGGSPRARSQSVNDVIQIATTRHRARLEERAGIEEDRLDDGDGQRRQVRTDSWRWWWNCHTGGDADGDVQGYAISKYSCQLGRERCVGTFSSQSTSPTSTSQ